MERGLLVTRFHYTNPVHPKLAIVTGMTRDGTFLVEGGRIVGPVRNLRFTQSYLEALAGDERREQRTADAPGRLRGRRGARGPDRQLDLHRRNGTLSRANEATTLTDIWVCGSCHSINRQRGQQVLQVRRSPGGGGDRGDGDAPPGAGHHQPDGRCIPAGTSADVRRLAVPRHSAPRSISRRSPSRSSTQRYVASQLDVLGAGGTIDEAAY